MKILLDFLPLVVFFAAYKAAGIYVAAGVAIVVAVAQIVWSLARRIKIKPVQWVSLGFIVIFCSATILLHDEFYFKLKWTLFYGSMGTMILVALAMKKNPLKSLLGQEIELPAAIWHKLSISWGIYFLVMAALNQYIAMVLSLDAYVNVKIFGGMALSAIFIVAQAIWLAKHLPEEPAKEGA